MNDEQQKTGQIDWIVFGFSGGIILVFVIAALINLDAVSAFVSATFDFGAKYFGAYWQVLAFAMFIVSLYLGFSKYGAIRLGNIEKPEIRTPAWVAMIIATTLAGGGVFWSAAEPLYHYMYTPPFYEGVEEGTPAAIDAAFGYAYLHWGFLAWAIVATIGGITILWAHYHRGMPIKPRTLIYPLFGEKAVYSHWGTAVDVFCIISVAAGTIAPIGMLGLQMAYFLENLFGIPDTFTTHVAIIAILVTIYCISAVTGVHRGIQWLSRFNAYLAVLLGFSLLLIGPGRFIIDTFLTSFSSYMIDFIPLSLYRGDPQWVGWWPVFYWAWFGGYGPVLAVFMARISKGRTIREIVLLIGIVAPVITNLWFTMLGGSGLYFELQNPGLISGVFETVGLPGVLYEIVVQLPLTAILMPLYMILITVFLATTGDSIAYAISMTVTGDENPNQYARIFWAIAMGAVALVLLRIAGLDALQNWVVITFVPVSIVLGIMLLGAPKLGRLAYKELIEDKQVVDPSKEKLID